VAQCAPELLPGGVYLLGADRSAMMLDFSALTADVGALVRAARDAA
jgi:hypothetical protein